MIGPRNPSSAFNRSPRPAFTSRRSSTSPSASPVEVRAPSRSVARYVLSASSSSPENLVASPRVSTRRPPASGSSVPVWPARRAPSSFFARCSTALELGPDGLSSRSTPSTAAESGAASTGSVAFGFFPGDGVIDQPGKAHAALDRSIVLEMQLGRDAQLQARAELGTQESGGALQPLLGLRKSVRFAQRGEEDLRVGKIRRHLDTGEGDHADARVLQVGTQQPGQFALDLVGDAAQPL